MYIIAIAIAACVVFVFGYVCGVLVSAGVRHDERVRKLLDDEEMIR